MSRKHSSSNFHPKLQPGTVQNRAARRRVQTEWVQGRDAKATLKTVQNAENFILIDRGRRPVATALQDLAVCFYLVQPGAVTETLADPRIDEAFRAGVPIFLCFARREDAVEMRSACRLVRLAIAPVEGRA
jgi:hypothetical protein